MKHIFIGDIHGKVELVEKALAKDGKKIFVGDFMDSFDRSSVDMFNCLRLVTEAIEKGEAEAIFGNHELSYKMPKIHRCSGFSTENEIVYWEKAKEVESLFKPYVIIQPNILVTHAGLTNIIWNKFNLHWDNLDLKLKNWWENIKSPAHWIGKRRGGLNSVGGIFWCDFNTDFRPIPGIIQIFGHTAGKEIRKVEDSYCIDCLDYTDDFLELEI